MIVDSKSEDDCFSMRRSAGVFVLLLRLSMLVGTCGSGSVLLLLAPSSVLSPRIFLPVSDAEIGDIALKTLFATIDRRDWGSVLLVSDSAAANTWC